MRGIGHFAVGGKSRKVLQSPGEVLRKSLELSGKSGDGERHLRERGGAQSHRGAEDAQSDDGLHGGKSNVAVGCLSDFLG